ncbi:amidase [Pigmentiphaga litoralis]|uniref:Amidase n=1 Tax=Pigmentiphaga litoralis TaxID=516702 RepID=A0A7Y9IZ48_9BURK|nr:amidase [Pigmentiphaga litoralis]NYE26345.1 amidase [Pigmentiphaga litoralis]NYE85465.1 amidase [Pigmentiphaga litoralis]
MSNEIVYASAVGLARKIHDRETSSRAVVDVFLARIAQHNPAINAVVVLQADIARRRAEAADAARANGVSWGPLHGVPITVKDSFDVQGLPSTFGLAALGGNIAARDALTVERLQAAGAIVLGKTNVPPNLADWQTIHPVYGTTRNPWDVTRTPGGSSGGSAAALASGFSALEIGSDIGGSIRMPAHYCGVWGHKPSFGLVPGRGHAKPGSVAPSDITVYGPLARSAGDLALALDVMAGPDPEAGAGWRLDLDPPGPRLADRYRVALWADDPAFPVDASVSDALHAAADSLRRSGVDVDETARPAFDSRDAYEIYVHLLRAATSGRQSDADWDANIAAASGLDPADRSYRALFLRGNVLTHRDWVGFEQRRHGLIQAWRDFFSRYDAVLCPVASTPAFTLVGDTPKHARQVTVNGKDEPSANDYFWLGLASASYLPSTTAPIGVSGAGLPVGAQLIGRFGSDRTCMALAQHLERHHYGFAIPPLFRKAIL